VRNGVSHPTSKQWRIGTPLNDERNWVTAELFEERYPDLRSMCLGPSENLRILASLNILKNVFCGNKYLDCFRLAIQKRRGAPGKIPSNDVLNYMIPEV